jgi:hypothetical protein
VSSGNQMDEMKPIENAASPAAVNPTPARIKSPPSRHSTPCGYTRSTPPPPKFQLAGNTANAAKMERL